MERFNCTHCGHHFESEVAEAPVCPNCFWSTSVEKEGDSTSRKMAGEAESDSSTVRQSPIRRLHPPFWGRLKMPVNRLLWLWLGGAAGVIVFVGIFFFASRHLLKQEEILQTIKSKNAEVIAAQAPELTLLPEERAILERRILLEPKKELDEEEKEMLARRTLFRTGKVRGLPGPPWDEKQFESFLEAQQSQYKMPLEWSYRRKLKKLFREHYLPAVQAFEMKDFLKARDEWIRSLGFPVYYNDIKKHQGVVLTMLRPYINDVLSKIGAMNSLLVEKDLYAAEEKVRESYEKLYTLLQSQSWEEANAALLELNPQLEAAKPVPAPVNPPPLPAEINLIDEGVREVLLAQVTPGQPSVPDQAFLREDLVAKEKVIQARLPGTLGLLQQKYDEALAFIQNRNWREAKEILENIDFPGELAEDARAKVQILSPWTSSGGEDPASSSLASEEKSG